MFRNNRKKVEAFIVYGTKGYYSGSTLAVREKSWLSFEDKYKFKSGENAVLLTN